MGFGNGRWICSSCGGFYSTINGGCNECKTKRFKAIIARKTAEKRKMGIPIKTYQKRARKAYISLLVNICKVDPERGERLIAALASRDGNQRRANQVRRRINGK